VTSELRAALFDRARRATYSLVANAFQSGPPAPLSRWFESNKAHDCNWRVPLKSNGGP